MPTILAQVATPLILQIADEFTTMIQLMLDPGVFLNSVSYVGIRDTELVKPTIIQVPQINVFPKDNRFFSIQLLYPQRVSG
jgi:hypothetical protein